MKIFFFVLATFATSYSFAATSTQLSCNLVRLTDKGAVVLGAVALNCAQRDIKYLGTQNYGVVAFSCERVGEEVATLVRLPQTNVTLSSGRTLSLLQGSSFSSYYATVDDALMINCRN